MSLPPIEEWRPIPGTNGEYECSDIGRVRSVTREVPFSNRVCRIRGKILAAPINRGGYRSIEIRMDGRRVRKEAQRWVARTFLGVPEPDDEVMHLDGDALNNCVENLRYGSHTENVRMIGNHGRNHNANKTHCHRGHEFTPENTRLLRTGKYVSRSCQTCKREYWGKR